MPKLSGLHGDSAILLDPGAEHYRLFDLLLPQAPGAALKPSARSGPPWFRSAWFDALQFMLVIGLLIHFTVQGAQSMGYQWKWHKVPPLLYRVIDGEILLGPLTKGLLVTLDIAWQAGLLALLIGVVTALLRLSRQVVAPVIARAYIEVIRNTPIMVQILIFYFIIAAILDIPRLWAGILCLAFYEGAFAAEIMRAAILGVHKGQSEAAQSLGFSTTNLYRDIVLPQAVPVMLPPLGGVLVNLVKHSAIVSVIAVFDLTTQARTLVSMPSSCSTSAVRKKVAMPE